MKQLSLNALPNLAIAAGATTPVPVDGAGALAWSTTLGATVVWTGSTWAQVGGGGGGGSPGGSSGQIQYNAAGSFAGAASVDIENGILRLDAVTTPTAPAADGVGLFGRNVAGRMLPAAIGPSGLDTGLQPLLARNKVGFWCPPGNGTTVPGVLGFTAFTATGTATSRNTATTSMFTRMRRLGYVSSGTAGSLAGARVAVAQVTIGTTLGGIPVGGFFKVIRFGCSDAATVAGARQFIGMTTSTLAPANVEPSTLANCIGVGHGAADTNLKIFHGGSAAQTPIDLGANFPANTLSADVYELALFCAPGSANVGWQVSRINTGHSASGSIAGTAATLPVATSQMTYSNNWRSNGSTALAVGLDLFSDYIETDQ